MKTSTLAKYNELIGLLKLPEAIKQFAEGVTIFSPEGENTDYAMKPNQFHELDLFCKDKGNAAWMRYEQYEKYLARIERRKKEAEAHEAFKKELFEEARANGSCMTDKQFQLIFAKAYEDEHSSGMESVREIFFELMEFIKEVTDAGTES